MGVKAEERRAGDADARKPRGREGAWDRERLLGAMLGIAVHAASPPPATAAAELAPNVYVGDATLTGAIALGFAAYSSAALGGGGWALLKKRAERVELLEVGSHAPLEISPPR